MLGGPGQVLAEDEVTAFVGDAWPAPGSTAAASA